MNNNSKLKNKLELVFTIPKPIHKADFLSSLPYKKPSFFKFVFLQLGYIRKRFWVLSMLILVLLNFYYLNIQLGKEVVGLLSATIPLFTLLSMSEIYKSNMYNMGELEASCKYDLGRITLIRLSIIGTFQFTLILVLLIIFKDKTQFGNLIFIIFTMTPYLLTTYISFCIANYYKSHDSLFICSGVTIMISSLVYLLSFNTQIYNNNYLVIWFVTFIIVILLIIKEIYNLLNNRGGLWNLA